MGAENIQMWGGRGRMRELNLISHNGKSVGNTKNGYFKKYAVNILLREMEVKNSRKN